VREFALMLAGVVGRTLAPWVLHLIAAGVVIVFAAPSEMARRIAERMNNG